MGKKATAANRLRESLEQLLDNVVKLNPSWIDYARKLKKLIDKYNEGSKNIEELAVFDLLTKPDPALTKSQEAQVKKTVRELLAKLKREKLVLDWKQRQATRAAVEVAIEEALDEGLPDAYDVSLFTKKSAVVFEHVFSA